MAVMLVTSMFFCIYIIGRPLKTIKKRMHLMKCMHVESQFPINICSQFCFLLTYVACTIRSLLNKNFTCHVNYLKMAEMVRLFLPLVNGR